MIRLFHAGYKEIISPDVHFGRINADFGQGFYTTDDKEFAYSWVREQPGAEIIINHYELDESSLKIKRFDRNSEWFKYIFDNRRAKPDIFAEYDLIIGPIANDTIYDTMGIITSGIITDDVAMKLLMIGPCSKQIVLKSRKAADNLKFVMSEVLSADQIRGAVERHHVDEDKFQEEFARVLEKEIEK